MDSNRIKKCIALFILLIFYPSVYGQNIKRYYVFSSQEKGSIFHLLPVALFEDMDGEKLSYDLTYTSWNDSITMNFTYKKPKPLKIDSIKYVSGESRVTGKVDKLYVEPVSEKWIHRYALKSKAMDFFPIYDMNATPEIIICSNGKKYIYRVRGADWRKYVPIGQKIFEMIHL